MILGLFLRPLRSSDLTFYGIALLINVIVLEEVLYEMPLRAAEAPPPTFSQPCLSMTTEE